MSFIACVAFTATPCARCTKGRKAMFVTTNAGVAASLLRFRCIDLKVFNFTCVNNPHVLRNNPNAES